MLGGGGVDLEVESAGAYTPSNANANGLSGAFDTINMAVPREGSGVGVVASSFRFTLRDNRTNAPVVVPALDVSFLDFDQAAGGSQVECMASGGFVRYSITADSQVDVSAGEQEGRTRFCATESGAAGDNPSDPLALTLLQRRRAVVLHFEATSNFSVVYSVGCLTKNFSYWPGLLFGRFCGGVATSILLLRPKPMVPEGGPRTRDWEFGLPGYGQVYKST